MSRRIYFSLIGLLFVTACAAVPPTDPAGPRRYQPAYPVLLMDNQQRRNDAAAAWAQMAQQRGELNLPAPMLQPVTATIQDLPDQLKSPLYLTRIGTDAEMNEEETRESLRRFLNQRQKLLGANPDSLSLSLQEKQADGTNLAVYEQRAFSFPLRGDYGRIEIRFANDRRITGLSSTAIPDVDKIQSALNASIPGLKIEEVTPRLIGRKVTYTEAPGVQKSFIIGLASNIDVQQIVVYPVLADSQPGALEFHLVWEVNLTDAPLKTIYYDALQDKVFIPGEPRVNRKVMVPAT